MSDKPVFLFVVGEDRYFLSHRMPAAEAAMAAGFDVAVMATDTGFATDISTAGIRFIPTKCHRGSRHLFQLLSAISYMRSVNQQITPTVIQNVGIRNVLIGMLSLVLNRKPHVINAINGLGFTFTQKSVKATFFRLTIMTILTLTTWLRSSQFLFQNEDDLRVFSRWPLSWEQAHIVTGSGVDVNKYSPHPLTDLNQELVIGMACRFVIFKGIWDIVQAMDKLANEGVAVKLRLAGKIDELNPASLSSDEVLAIDRRHNIEVCGFVEDMKAFWSGCHIGALFSHGGEGVPMSLMQPAAMGRPLITTDTAGNRLVCRDTINGFVVPAHSADEIRDKILIFYRHPRLLTVMGLRSIRHIQERGFSAQDISKKLTVIYSQFLAS